MSQFNCIRRKQIFSRFAISRYSRESKWTEKGERFSVTLTLLDNPYKYVIICSTKVLRANFGQKSDSIGIFRYVTDAFFGIPRIPRICTRLDCIKYLMARHSQQRSRHRVISFAVARVVFIGATRHCDSSQSGKEHGSQFIAFHFTFVKRATRGRRSRWWPITVIALCRWLCNFCANHG